MKIDGKENVKERIKVFENDKYITYLYIFENGNSYRDTVRKLKLKDQAKVDEGKNKSTYGYLGFKNGGIFNE